MSKLEMLLDISSAYLARARQASNFADVINGSTNSPFAVGGSKATQPQLDDPLVYVLYMFVFLTFFFKISQPALQLLPPPMPFPLTPQNRVPRSSPRRVI